MSDIFQRKPLTIETPITADMVTIQWSNNGTTDTTGVGNSVALAQATQLSLQYNQPVNRRWTLGTSNGANPICVIYPGRPLGSMQIQRLFADSNENIFSLDGWDPCGPLATIQIALDGSTSVANCTVTGGIYTLYGAIVTSYGMTAEAEGLTLIDNINIEFMQLSYQDSSTQTATTT